MATSRYRNKLPHVDTDKVFLGECGFLTEILFHPKLSLTVGEDLTVLKLMDTEEGCKHFDKFYRDFADLALNKHKVGFLLEHGAQWKMNLPMATETLGLTREKWHELFVKSVKQSAQIRDDFEEQARKRGETCPPLVIGVVLGAREGGYKLTIRMTPEEAEAFHYHEVKMAAETPEVDFVTAYTISDPNEAIGFVKAAQKFNLPIAVSFVVGKGDCKLQSGHTLKEAVKMIDDATNNGPLYYMINCSHPEWFMNLFDKNEPWVKRIKGVSGNGSKKSHAELDECDTLDTGDPAEYGRLLGEIQKKTGGNVNIFKGCCGTDIRHMQESAKHVCQ